MEKQQTGSVMLIKKIQNIWNNFKQSLFERVLEWYKIMYVKMIQLVYIELDRKEG